MKPVIPATDADLSRLGSPEALDVLRTLQARGWLTAEAPAVETYFGDHKDHPARALLLEAASFGGTAGALSVGILVFMALLALLMTMSAPTMSAPLLTMWGGIGVTAALLVRQHPGLKKLLACNRGK